MKYVQKNFCGVPLFAVPIPYKRVVNNGYTIETQSDFLIKQLEENERKRLPEIIDWHLFKVGETILIDYYGNQYGCIFKTDHLIQLNAIVGIKL